MEDVEQLARRAYEAFLRRDVEAFAEIVADDAVLKPALSGMLENRTYHGPEGVGEFFASFDDMWADFELELGELEVDGDRVLQLGSMSATARGSGLEFKEESGSVTELRDGKIVSWRAYMSHAKAREVFEQRSVDAEALARAAYDAFNRRDADALSEIATEDAELVPAVGVVGEERYVGRDGAVAFFATLGEMWSELRSDIAEVQVDGDRILVLGTTYATTHDGVRFELPVASIIHVRDSKLARLEGYATQERALTLFRERA